jgi:signal transduction histidine kinase
VEPGLPPIRFCKKAIQQCAINLLSNAICACSTLPHGRERKVTVRVYRAHGGEFALSVQDTGPGIPKDQVPRILEGFKSTKGSGGTGLGLQVVQKLARAHGGHLEVGGQEGEGAVFTMVLQQDPTL